MSGGTVCVLALNGRRQNVKCTPNTTIMQVLEEVCLKQELKADEYDLKHHNKVLDLSQTFRFSGLPNNAQLELVPATRVRAETDIVLAANLENGKRLMGQFSPNKTLLEVLENLCPETLQQELSPVVIYTRREIYGGELEHVTLRSLGLTGGRAMIRVLNRAPEDLKNQANVSAIIPSKPAEEKPYIRKYQPVESKNESKPPEISDEDSKDPNADVPSQKIQQKDNVDLIKLAREKRKSSESQSPLLGERKKSTSEKVKFLPKSSKRKNKCSCKQHANMDMDDEDFSCPQGCTGTCKDSDEDLEKEEFVFLGERNAMLFSQETAEAIPHEDLPDEFFDLTIDDARKLLRDVKRQRHFMENTPLLTSNLRHLEDSQKQIRMMNRYKKAIIRVQFPDQVVLQGTFNPSDSIKDVVEFVRQYLEDKSAKFYVFTTPPKNVLNESRLLIEEGFVPGAVVHFGTDGARKKSYLRRDLQNKFTSNSMASLAAAQIRRKNTRKCGTEPEEDFDDVDINEELNRRRSSGVNDGASTSSGATQDVPERKAHYPPPENLPKWFKPV